MKSGSLNLLELPGPVKACNGIALPLLYLTTISKAQATCFRMFGYDVLSSCGGESKENFWNMTPYNFFIIYTEDGRSSFL
jgi:hypothetical protein